MSNITGILQKDGSICENSDIHGVEDMDELSQELMGHVEHGNIPKVFQSWLRKYRLCTASQIGAWCRVDELENTFPWLKEKKVWLSALLIKH